MGLYKISLKFRLSLSFLALVLVFLSSSSVVYASYEATFVVTAYYSPAPDQDYYVTGSYQGDRLLNGNGTNGASGAQVFPGMIAAPPDFAFGTKIYLPGFGTGEVQDRGGAIKNNRIDLWMGFGVEGRDRAMSWGKRTVPASIVYSLEESKSMQVEVFYDFVQDVNYYVDMILEAIRSSYNSYNPGHLEYFTNNVGEGSTGDRVVFVQESLRDFGYLTEDQVTGTFDSVTEQAVINYQIGRDIVDGAFSFGAGFVGPQTRQSLEQDLDLYKEGKYKKPVNYFEIISLHEDLKEESVVLDSALQLGSRGEEVEWLQQQLVKLGYLRVEPNDYFGELTQHALKKFQLKAGIVSNYNESGAGVFGPKTRAYFSSLVDDRVEMKAQIAMKRDGVDASETILAKKEEEDTVVVSDSEVNVESDSGQARMTKTVPTYLTVEMDYGDNRQEVKDLQNLLSELGYFKGTFTTNFFGDSTREAVLAFQLDKGVVRSTNDLGAGRVGPKTLEALTKYL